MKFLNLITFLFFITHGISAQNAPKLHYDFENESISDQSGNGYDGQLRGSAVVKKFGNKNVLYTGINNGYVDMGEKTGELISSLSDFTISYMIYVPASNKLNHNGGFIATFSNSDDIIANPVGYAFMSAKFTGYSITKTDYRAETKVIKDEQLPVGEWVNMVYTQQGRKGTLYVNGVQVKQNAAVSIFPKNLGKTKYNWIGRSCYTGDVYLDNIYIDDFKIFDTAMNQEDIKSSLSNSVAEYNNQKEPCLTWRAQGNPVITHKYTADAASMVYNDTLWIFAGEDFTGGQSYYKMNNWVVFSTTDMKTFTEHPIPLKGVDFAWSSKNAWASHVVEKDGKFYFYTSTNTTGIGVAVADRPEGPYKDALGRALLTTKDCFASSHSWACIDPAIFIEDDGTAWIFWGNGQCYYAKLKPNMIEIDGPVKQVMFDGFGFTEAPWIHKKDGKYYLTYASGFPEKISYAMADNIEGPWEYKGILNEIAGNSNTNHQAISEYKGNWYFVYHNGAMQTDGSSYSRSVCIDNLYFNEDGTMKKIQMTSEGVDRIAEGNEPNFIIENRSTAKLKVYPNPSKEFIHVSYSDLTSAATIEIHDLNGKILISKKFGSLPAEVNVSKLQKGNYILKCSIKKGNTESANIIIE